jgi:cell division protein FtsB
MTGLSHSGRLLVSGEKETARQIGPRRCLAAALALVLHRTDHAHRRVVYEGIAGRVALTTGVCSTTNIPPHQVENRRIQMRLALSCALLAGVLIGLSACNKAESPEGVQANVAKAKSEAVEENAKADEKMKQVEAEAAKDRADAEAKAADKSVGAVVDSAVTQAEGETKVALAKCEALEGDAQKACKDKANAHMDAVKAKAKAAKSD